MVGVYKERSGHLIFWCLWLRVKSIFCSPLRSHFVMKYWRKIRSAGIRATYFGKEIEQRMQTVCRAHPTGFKMQNSQRQKTWAG